jgi:hypothetical protein
MSDVTDAPKAGLKGAEAALKKVPKVVWVAGGAGLVGFIYIKRKKNAEAAAAAASASTNSTNGANATPTADQGLTDQGIDPATGVSYASELAAAYANASDQQSYGSSSGDVGGDGTSSAPDEVADLSGLISSLYPNGISGATGTTGTALSTSSPGTTPASVAPAAAGTVVSTQPAATLNNAGAAAPAPATKVTTQGCPAAFPHSGPSGCFKTEYVVVKGIGYNKHTYQNGKSEYVKA